MSTPHQKQFHLRRILNTAQNHRHLERIPATGPVAQAPTRPVNPRPSDQGAPSTQASAGTPAGPAALFTAVAILLGSLTVVQGYTLVDGDVIEGFEEQDFPDSPDGTPYYTFSGPGLVSTNNPQSGDNNLVNGLSTACSVFTLSSAITYLEFWTLAEAVGSSRATIGMSTGTTFGNGASDSWVSYSYGTGSTFGFGGSKRLNVAGTSNAISVTSGTFVQPIANTWRHMAMEFSFSAPTNAIVTIYDLDNIGSALSSSDSTAVNGFGDFTNVLFCPGTTTGPLHTDNINFGALSAIPEITGNTVALTNIVGYSMDGTGENIAVRYNGGADVATYGTQDLSTQIASAATGCNRSDGVVSTTINDAVWITYAECNASAGLVDTLVIRDQNLGIPMFANECGGFPEDEPTTDDQGIFGRVDVPEQMSQIGTISDLSFDYEECINPSGPAIGSFAGWTLSNSAEGWIGAFAVGYGQNGLGVDQLTSRAQHPALLDTSGSPYQVDDFCSWVGPDGNDYIAGVSQDGVAAIYQVTRNVVVSSTNGVNGPGEENIEFTFFQKFRNAGPYAGSNAVACAQDKVAFQTPTEIRILDNITTSPVLFRTIPNVYSSARGLAFTGSAEYLAYLTPTSEILVHQLDTGNSTGRGSAPSGTWLGMEFDFSGQNLAAFASAEFVLFDSEEATCELDNNCEQLGNVGDDESGPTTSSTQTTTGGTGGGIEDLSESPYFWVLIWLLVVNVVIAILSWRTRAGFSGSVYLVASVVVYIIGMIGYGTDKIQAWPLLVVIAIVMALGVAGFVRGR